MVLGSPLKPMPPLARPAPGGSGAAAMPGGPVTSAAGGGMSAPPPGLLGAGAGGGGAVGGPAQPPQQMQTAAGGCPPGQQMINGRCRHPGDFPCPPGQCKDVNTGQCRTPGHNEKVNETDTAERESGGGRGYCKQRSAGGGGGGGSAEQQYFDRLVGQGDWTEWPRGSGWYYNDPGNDRSRRVWVNRGNLQLDSTGRGYQSIQGDAPPGYGSQGPSGPGGGPGGGGGGGIPGLNLNSDDLSSQIRDALASILGGGQTRFSPEVMADITAGQKGLEQQQIATGVESANEDAAARGIAFSGIGANLGQQAKLKAQQTFAQGQREARQQKAFYDFEDKMTALGKAQDWVNSLRQYSLGLEQNSIQREQIQASILIARERIAAEAQQLTQQLASQRDLLGMQIGSQEWMFMQGQLKCLMSPESC